MFKKKLDKDRHGPRLMPNNCQHLDQPYFLVTNYLLNNFLQITYSEVLQNLYFLRGHLSPLLGVVFPRVI
jgi:hypothetical protein